MAHVYDQIDVAWSWNGDISTGRDGDIADTSEDYLISLSQDLHSVAASEIGDWELYLGIGAGLDEFIGEPNTKETANLIHDRLKVSLVSLGLVAEGDLSIRVVPVHIHKLLIVVKVNAVPTPWNSLVAGETLTVQLVFDFLEQGITFFEKTPWLSEH